MTSSTSASSCERARLRSRRETLSYKSVADDWEIVPGRSLRCSRHYKALRFAYTKEPGERQLQNIWGPMAVLTRGLS